jgi:hypothetical protein
MCAVETSRLRFVRVGRSHEHVDYDEVVTPRTILFAMPLFPVDPTGRMSCVIKGESGHELDSSLLVLMSYI